MSVCAVVNDYRVTKGWGRWHPNSKCLWNRNVAGLPGDCDKEKSIPPVSMPRCRYSGQPCTSCTLYLFWKQDSVTVRNKDVYVRGEVLCEWEPAGNMRVLLLGTDRGKQEIKLLATCFFALFLSFFLSLILFWERTELLIPFVSQNAFFLLANTNCEHDCTSRIPFYW